MNETPVLRTRIISALLFCTVWAGAWDIWWHGAIGRDSFWIPPHLLLYSSVLLAICVGFYTWWQERGGEAALVWKRVALSLLVILLAAPLDELWHRTFGKEVFSSPLIVWSPPHLMIVLGILASFVALLPILLEDTEDAKRIFVPLTFAGIIHIFSYLIIPFEPRGSYHLLGYGGELFAGLVLSYSLLASRDRLKGMATAFMTALFYLIPLAVRFADKVTPGTGVIPYERVPAFLEIAALLVPALCVDMLWGKQQKLVIGFVVGFFHAALIHGFGSSFLSAQYQYGGMEVAIAIGSGVVGGLLGAFLSKVRIA